MENFEPIDDLPGELGTGDWGHFDKLSASLATGEMATGDWRLGTGELGTGDDSSQSPIPNPQSLIPNPQSPIPNPQSPIPIQETAASRRLLLIYLIPVLGFFPSLWTLYSRRGSREQLIVSRLSITLAFTWLLIYLLLGAGAETSEFFTLRLLILNSFFTSGYFLVSVWLMFRLIKNKSNRLPGFSNFAERVLGKYLP